MKYWINYTMRYLSLIKIKENYTVKQTNSSNRVFSFLFFHYRIFMKSVPAFKKRLESEWKSSECWMFSMFIDKNRKKHIFIHLNKNIMGNMREMRAKENVRERKISRNSLTEIFTVKKILLLNFSFFQYSRRWWFSVNCRVS